MCILSYGLVYVKKYNCKNVTYKMCIRDRNNKHDGRPSRRGQNSQVDKDRHENRRITPSGRDVRRGNGKKEKDSESRRSYF